jgi:hypothetical protein
VLLRLHEVNVRNRCCAGSPPLDRSRRKNLRTKAELTATRRRRATRMSDAQPTPSNVRVEIAVDGTSSFETSGTLAEAAAATNAHLTEIVEKDKTERAAKKAKS